MTWSFPGQSKILPRRENPRVSWKLSAPDFSLRKSKFSEGRIAGILKEAEADLAVAEVARKHGIGVVTFYPWRSKYGG